MSDEQKPREPLSPESISFLAKFIADDSGGKAWALNQSLAKAIANGWTIKASGEQIHESNIVPNPNTLKPVPYDGPPLCSLGSTASEHYSRARSWIEQQICPRCGGRGKIKQSEHFHEDLDKMALRCLSCRHLWIIGFS